MFCTKCGSKIEDGVKFCTNCGAKVELENVVRMQVEEVKGKVNEVKEQFIEKANKVKEDVSDQVSNIKEQATDQASRVKPQAANDATYINDRGSKNNKTAALLKVLGGIALVSMFIIVSFFVSISNQDSGPAMLFIFMILVIMIPLIVLCNTVAKLIDKVD